MLSDVVRDSGRLLKAIGGCWVLLKVGESC